MALQSRGDYSSAESHAQHALALAEAAGLRSVQAGARYRLAKLADEQGDYATAKRYDEEALRLYREAGDRPGELDVTIEIGGDGRYRHEFVEAWLWLGKARELARQLGDRLSEATILYNLGNTFYKLGDYVRAREYLELALPVMGERGPLMAMWTVWSLSNVTRCLRDFRAARTYAEQALLFGRGIGTLWSEALPPLALGRLHEALGDVDAARRCFEQSAALLRGSDTPLYALEPQADLAALALGLGDLAQAQTHVADIVAYLEAGGDVFHFWDAFSLPLVCHQVLHAAGDPRSPGNLEAAHALLLEKAAKIPDQAQRRSYLEKVASHREIVREWLLAHAGA